MTIDLASFLVAGKGRDSVEGFNPQFSSALANMLYAAPPEIRTQLQIASGYRSPEKQAQLYQEALRKYGSEAAARKWVAPPGKSQHNHGNAADLHYASPAALDWARSNAGKFGLAFPLGHENWHIELASARNGAPSQTSPTQALPNVAPMQAQSLPPFDGAMPAVGETGIASMFAAMPAMGQMAQAPAADPLAARKRREALYTPLPIKTA